jgi:chemotaxis protein MotB
MGRYTLGLAGLLVVLLATGCQDPKDMQIQALQERVQGLESDNADLESRLAGLMTDHDNANRRALELQRRIDELNRQLASAQSQQQSTQQGRWTESGPFAWTDIGSDILFDSGKATLKADGNSIVSQVASEIQSQYGDRSIWVIGHTDSDPIRVTKNLYKDNLELSQERARVVALELQKSGIDPTRVIAGGQGEANPKAPNDTKENKRTNRRVQIVAVARPDAG